MSIPSEQDIVIVKNALFCRKCNVEIESRTPHDEQGCPGGHIHVDGGHELLRRWGEVVCYDERSLHADRRQMDRVSALLKSMTPDEVAQRYPGLVWPIERRPGQDDKTLKDCKARFDNPPNFMKPKAAPQKAEQLYHGPMKPKDLPTGAEQARRIQLGQSPADYDPFGIKAKLHDHGQYAQGRREERGRILDLLRATERCGNPQVKATLQFIIAMIESAPIDMAPTLTPAQARERLLGKAV